MDQEYHERRAPRCIDLQACVPPTLVASSSQNAVQRTDFFRSCKLCADGAAALTTTEQRAIEVYNLTTEGSQLAPARRFVQSGNILETLWYPTAIPEDPSTFCFLASVRECPVKLLDASDGRVHDIPLRASYRIVDHRERQIAPHSMAFNSVASKLYCGFQDAIEVFDIASPGEGERLFTTPSKKSRSGLKGIISALAFCPDYSGLYAAGTFSSSLVLFAESNQAEIIQCLGGVKGPVTQVKFNPMQPHILYATSRQTNSILSWDIRGHTSTPLQEFERFGLTNQRLSFDVDAYGTTMVTGDKDGFISCFKLDGTDTEKATLKFKAHDG
ncbi:hypothetical protein K439DRAFT_1617196 [Ramaria rubella]|nr:hypothetical protein K439DRAFT_1617196 [Ramaria rubella]